MRAHTICIEYESKDDIMVLVEVQSKRNGCNIKASVNHQIFASPFILRDESIIRGWDSRRDDVGVVILHILIQCWNNFE